MAHPLVDQLRFARSEFRRGLEGVTPDEASRRFLPANCMSWNIGHLAWQEQRYWLHFAQGVSPVPRLNEEFAYGASASTPALADVWADWHAVTSAADPWLDALTSGKLQSNIVVGGKAVGVTFGSLLLRNIYHYWFHTGENAAIRQHLGHTGLPDFIGDIDEQAPYRPEARA